MNLNKVEPKDMRPNQQYIFKVGKREWQIGYLLHSNNYACVEYFKYLTPIYELSEIYELP